MCICEVSHLSSEGNKPVLKYDNKGNVVGIENTKLWQISLAPKILPIDDKVSDTSTNPIQNKVIKGYVDDTANSLRAEISGVDVQLTDLKDAIGNLTINTDRIVDNAVTETKLSKELQAKITPDTGLSEASEKTVQNKVIAKAINALSARITPLETTIEDIANLETRIGTVEQQLM